MIAFQKRAARSHTAPNRHLQTGVGGITAVSWLEGPLRSAKPEHNLASKLGCTRSPGAQSANDPEGIREETVACALERGTQLAWLHSC